MSFNTGECIYIRDSAKTVTELIPARIVWSQGGKVVVEIEAERLADVDESEVLIYYTIDRTFMQQAAAVEGSGPESEELVGDNDGDVEMQEMDVSPDCELLVLSISPMGTPVSAENRECFRVRNRNELSVKLNDIDDALLADISQTGLAVVCDLELEIGDVAQLFLEREDVQVAGPARIQSKRKLRNGQLRYGMLCVERSMQQSCGRLSMMVQRDWLRSRSKFGK